MFFITYLRRELRSRIRQAVFIALGLALGIGLVITVIGASSGVKAAQARVLRSLYGIGTDVTVTKVPAPVGKPASGAAQPGQAFQTGPGGGESCVNGKCKSLPGGTVIDNLASLNYGSLSDQTVAAIARLHDVSAAAGGLALIDNRIVIPRDSSSASAPTSVTVDGTDISHPGLGPLSNARLSSGRAFTTADDNSDVALADSSYATSSKLKVSDTVTLANIKFKIIGIVIQPQASSPPQVYIPLPRAQALAIDPATSKSLKGAVNTIYVTTASATDIPAVQKEIEKLVRYATVTSSSDLASEVTGSVASAAKLAGDLGKWLAVLVLIAAFAVASLLTMTAVSRRVQEFGTLKALGWRGSRIVCQVVGESVGTGIAGGIAGVGLGFVGVAIIDKIAPRLTATLPSAGSLGGLQAHTAAGGSLGGPGTAINPAATAHATVSVPLSASVTIGAVLLAVLLATAGGLLAGSLGGWRAARLRPAAALARVA